MTGGNNNASVLKSSELYDASKNTWSTAGIQTTDRAFHTATLLGNGKVLILAGSNASSTTVSSAQLYDPRTNRWSTAPALKNTRQNHTATLLGNGTLLVVGGTQSAGGGNESSAGLSKVELYAPRR